MEESIFQTFLLLAYTSVAMISVTIANYAVSASYLGREIRLSRLRMQKGEMELQETLKKLKDRAEVGEIKSRVQKFEKEKKNLRFLSWYRAVLFPAIPFGICFISSIIGINIDILPIQPQYVQGLVILSIIGISGGVVWLLLVIRAVDSAAKTIPVPKLLVRFETKNFVDRWAKHSKSGELKEVTFCFENDGEDIAEGLLLYVHFPPEFTVHPKSGRYDVYKQEHKSEFPNYSSAVFREQTVHVGSTLSARVLLTMPEKKGHYNIPIQIYERKTGYKRDNLLIVVE